MSSFTTPLVLEFLDHDAGWRLAEEFDYEEGDLDSGVVIRVPAGFVTDFASVPRVLWNLLPPTGPYGKAAVLHDWLYHKPEIDGKPIDRAHCDKILLEAMGVLGVGWWTRWTIFSGVRIGGWVAWHAHRRGDTAAEKK